MRISTSLRISLLSWANSLRASQDIIEWSSSFQVGLAGILPEVDRVSLNVNRTARAMSNDACTAPGVSVQSAADDDTSTLLVASGPTRDHEHFRRIALHSGCPIDEYDDPVVVNYFEGEFDYLGSLVLWRKRTSSPLPPATMQLLGHLEGFIRSQLIWAVQRYQRSHMVYMSAVRSAESVLGSKRLTRRQKEVLLCRLRGLTVAATARTLHISDATARRHLRTVKHRIQDLLGVDASVLGTHMMRTHTNS